MHHSQGAEQETVIEYFEKNPPREKYLLDIGAWTGLEFSNSRALIVEHGWNGTLVEPSPRPFVALAANYAKESLSHQVQLVNAFIAADSGFTNFWHTADAISTNDPGVHAAWSGVVSDYLPCVVPKVSVDQFFDAFQGPVFFTLDCEGETWNIFNAIPARIWDGIQCFCVEHAAAGTSYETAMADIFKKKGFKILLTNGENIVAGR
jgi:FkbM family methyltransferase